ncbi:MAG: glycosyltransferase [Luteitalea sp.]|nr:glycosyltransferase [Luteitalea sp.]
MRLACVVHRYGADIAGGSEAHCRLIAEHLAVDHDVTVLTTCARDHVTWQNAYPPGESRVNGIRVVRFRVARPRSLHRFAEISEVAFGGRASAAEQERWFRENGPDAPELLDHLSARGGDYDRVLFWAFRYSGSFFGLPLVADRAVLVPTAEEDPLIKLDVLGPYFALPAGFLFLTPEEQALVARRASGPLAPASVIGSGLDPAAAASAAPLDRLGIRRPFVLYLGRIDPNKGCDILFRYFERYHAERASPLDLVMAGPANMPLLEHPHVKQLGFVDSVTREALLARASLLMVPSRYESLSLVLLEAWNHGLAALVNARCLVLKGQAQRANGALYYQDYDEFARALDYLLEQPEIAEELGRQGLAYVDREYRWPRVMQKINALLTAVGPSPRPPS